VSVRIVDKKAGFSTTSKAIGLQYRVSEILACMGVADRFLARGSTPTAVNIFVRDRRLVQLKFVASETETGRGAFRPRAIVIPQSETERLLGDLLTELDGFIEWNSEFLGFEQDGRGVRSRLRSGDVEQECTSDWLISCEGAHSVIREQAGFRFVGKTYPLSFLLADAVWRERSGMARIMFGCTKTDRLPLCRCQLHKRGAFLLTLRTLEISAKYRSI
jgi:2-polyprenyl-6-methoxyphenol hydroxylase-like FAD-dependent oxidoreductase